MIGNARALKALQENKPDRLLTQVKIMLQAHIGQAAAISLAELSQQVFGKVTAATKRQVREIVSELVINYDLHIVSDTKTGGFYYASTQEEIDRNIADLESRRQELEKRAEGLRRARAKIFHVVYDPLQERLL
ncbi:MAG: hypothetical protein ABSA51_07525 [Anaerolineaceae bacterium]|jgi:hypothetical protein